MRRLPPYDLLKRRLQADQTLDRIEAALDRVAVLVANQTDDGERDERPKP